MSAERGLLGGVLRDAKRGVRRGLGGMVDVVFPKQCLLSDAPLGDGEVDFSADVREQIAKLAVQPYCRRCGTMVGPHESHDRSNPCGRCAERDLGVHTLVRVGAFEQPLKRLVYRLKFAGQWELAKAAAPMMVQALRGVSEEMRLPVDWIVPLPLHWRRRMKRGFDQTQELAVAMEHLGAGCVSRCLKRVRETREQAGMLSRTQRKENVHGAFAAKPDARLHGKHIWLLDDVCTTGATLHAAATALRKLAPAIRPAGIHAVVLCVTESKAPVRVEELDADEVGGDVAEE